MLEVKSGLVYVPICPETLRIAIIVVPHVDYALGLCACIQYPPHVLMFDRRWQLCRQWLQWHQCRGEEGNCRS